MSTQSTDFLRGRGVRSLINGSASAKAAERLAPAPYILYPAGGKPQRMYTGRGYALLPAEQPVLFKIDAEKIARLG